MSTSGITFGKVVAAAGIAVGAVLVGTAIFSGMSAPDVSGLSGGVGDFFKNIGDGIAKLFTGGASRTATAIAGAGTVAGSYMLLNAMKNKEEDLKDATVSVNQPVEGGFAEKIAMDRAMMRARTAMAAQAQMGAPMRG